MCCPIFVSKVAGTVTLGLWAGYNFSLVQRRGRYCHCVNCRFIPKKCVSCFQEECNSTSTLQYLHNTFGALMKSLHISAVSGLVCITNTIAYTLSSRSGKHPYLLYVALASPLVGVLQFYGSKELSTQVKKSIEFFSQTKEAQESETASISSNDLTGNDYDHVTVNDAKEKAELKVETPGEDKENLFTHLEHGDLSVTQKYRIFSTVVAGLSGFLYLVSVIGLAGEKRRV